MLYNNSYEVAVCGGGIAGIAAALAAARGGKKVILFEKQYILGGLATAGLITIYLPLCDGYGKQVSFGLAEELLRLSIKYGYEERYPDNWLDGVGTRTEKDKRFEVRYNAQVFAILAERELLKAGVDILYGSYVVDAETENDRIKSISVENKSGRTVYEIKSVIDATGDCDIAHFANAPTAEFGKKNVLASWYYHTDKNGYDLNKVGYADTPDEEREESEEIGKTDHRFAGLDGKEISDMVCLSHKQTLNHWLNRRKEDSTTVLSTMATIPLLRMTRRLVGEYTLAFTQEHTYLESSIGMISSWRRRGPVYEVPFETLYSKKVKNLLVAGRCTSVDEDLWELMRVIPCCAVTGEAAGTAASLSDDFSALDVPTLQRQLQKNGVVLHERDL